MCWLFRIIWFFIPAVNDWLNVISEHVDVQLPCIMDCVMLQYKVVISVVTRVWGLIIRKPLSITGYCPSAYASSLRKTSVWMMLQSIYYKVTASNPIDYKLLVHTVLLPFSMCKSINFWFVLCNQHWWVSTLCTGG